MAVDYDKLWREIDEIGLQKNDFRKRPHERTIHDFRRRWHASESTVQKIVDKLVEENKLGVRVARCANGKIVNVYFPIGDFLTKEDVEKARQE